MKIAPLRVLDVGVGFGRWGMIIREFCDVWYGRVARSSWAVRIEGVEGFAPNIDEYHRAFYDQIHVGDFRSLASTLSGRWDVIIFGDVLEHFEKPVAVELLEWSLGNSDYVLLNIPLGTDWPQEEIYQNPFERHLSTWEALEFQSFCLRRQAFFRDFANRPFGSFVLSKDDPKNLSQQLFSQNTGVELAATSIVNEQPLNFEEFQILDQIRSLVSELQGIKRSRSYRIAKAVRQSRVGPLFRRIARLVLPEQGATARALFGRKATPPLAPGDVRIQPLGRHSPNSQGNEVWLLSVNPQLTSTYDLRQIRTHPAWEIRTNTNTASGFCLFNPGRGYADVRATPDMRLVFMTHPWSGIAEVNWNGNKTLLDLYSSETNTLQFDLQSGERKVGVSPWQMDDQTAPVAVNIPTVIVKPEEVYTQAEQEWIERMTQNPQPVSIQHPEWRGVRSSACQHFDVLLDIDDQLNATQAEHYARLLAESACSNVVIQGFPLTYRYLVDALHRIAPRIPVYVIWHGNFLQTCEDYAWTGFRAVEHMCRNGKISKWGFVKKGMAEIMAAQGLRTGFVMNLVRDIPLEPSTPLPDGPHLGIWSLYTANWRKPPYAMLAAASALKGAVVHASGVDTRTREFADLLNLKMQMDIRPVRQASMPQALGGMHVNLYVTLSECAPMLPLESLAAGAPCLFGPNSHYFEDHEYLHKRLVVSSPDSAATIRAYIPAVIEERSSIIEAYREYAPLYNQRARASLEDFLEMKLPQQVAA